MQTASRRIAASLTRTGALLRAAACAGMVAGASLAMPVPTASAQTQIGGQTDPVVIAEQRHTLSRLINTRIEVELDETPLRDVVEFIENVTQTSLEPLWLDDRADVGLDPDLPITMNARAVDALTFIEMILEKADRADGINESTWMFSNYGAFVFGPKERLNRQKRIQLYDINDLLFEVRDFTNAPEFDLNAVFQQGGQTGGGGGGGQSPFQQANQDPDRMTREELIEDLLDVVVSLVEPEQWMDAGGTGGSIREFRGTFLVNAADYIHRQLDGYSWFTGPTGVRVSQTSGRRYVTFSGQTAIGEADIAGVTTVTGAVPGGGTGP